VDSDTLKRHQKLHLAEPDKGSKRSDKSGVVGGKRSNRGSDASRSDISILESPVDSHPPTSEVAADETAQRFSATTALYTFDVGDSLNFSNFGAVDALFPLGFGIKEEGQLTKNAFEEQFGPLEDGLIGSLSMNYSINPGNIWGSP
jgi:hypothetical protein